MAALRHVEKVSGSVAATCRYSGISRQCYYIWLRRYEAEGAEGLRDRSSAPHQTPHATQADIVEKNLWLRQQYHFDPAKIAMYLQRYHDVKVSASGVWRILRKVGLNRLPASQRYKRRSTRWKRYEKQRPGHQLQVDVNHRPTAPSLARHSTNASDGRIRTHCHEPPSGAHLAPVGLPRSYPAWWVCIRPSLAAPARQPHRRGGGAVFR